MNTLGDVKAKVRAKTGDVDGDFATDAYLLPLINDAYESAVSYLEVNTGCGTLIDEKDVTLTAVATGTSSLLPMQAQGNPLAGLYKPDFLFARSSNLPLSRFIPGDQRTYAPILSPPQNRVGINGVGAFEWAWVSNQIRLSYINGPFDLLVRGEFQPAPLLQDADVLVGGPKMAMAVSFLALGLVGVERGNAGWVTTGKVQGEAELDKIGRQMVMSTHGTSHRIGRINGYRYKG